MGGHYEKGLYDQLVEAIERLELMDAKVSGLTSNLKYVNAELKSANSRIIVLEQSNAALKEENADLRKSNEVLRSENKRLTEDNERMKRILNNDSSNSSNPPSSDGLSRGKPVNSYNGRVKTNRKAGAQTGHAGTTISKKDVEEGIAKGLYVRKLEEIGNKESGKWITKYRLDLETVVTATEIRIYADENGKFNVPDELRGEVFYGDNIRAIAAYLYSEGVMANDRIGDFINSLSGDKLSISNGSIYNFCRDFSDCCKELESVVENNILNGNVLYTDATVISNNGEQNYIRNFSNEKFVLFKGASRKNLKTLEEFDVLKNFTGTICHDHETAMYNFGKRHAECNVHLGRYLLKNTQEAMNRWSHNLSSFLFQLNEYRNELKAKGIMMFSDEQLVRYEARYDEIVALGMDENKKTTGKYARDYERALLKRLKKYKTAHLLFLHDFSVPFSNNLSEKDLRICKNRENMSGGFRTDIGRDMYCVIMSVIGSLKRQKINLLYGIKKILNGAPIFS